MAGLPRLATVVGPAEVVASAEDVAVVGDEDEQGSVREEDVVVAEAEGGEDMTGQSICLQITP